MSTEAYRAARARAARAYYWRHHDRALARRRAQSLANRSRTDDEIAADRARLRPDGRRTCPRCGERRTLDAFGLDRHNPDGLTTACRACRRT